MALTIGSLLAGRYEITAPIATGGMGEVWKARDNVLERVVAAKVLKSEYTDDPSFLARFRNEARHTAALSHPNIASVYDYGETQQDGQQLAFLVMEFVEGQPLVTILHEQGRLPIDWTLHVLEQSADGLSAAHRGGVVHRDIKPGNLIVRPDGVVKLTDFGIAQARDATPLTRTGMVVGTAQYLSPEQAQGMEVTAASDVYSLGVVAYECLAGTRPFDGASQVAIALAHINRPPPPLPADVPPAVRLLVERALAKDAADRFPDGGAFAAAIRTVAAGGSLAALAPHGNPPTTPAPVVGLADGRTQVFATPVTGAATGATAFAGAAALATGPARAMPPLHAPDDEYEWPVADDDLQPERRGPSRRIWLAVALLALLLLGGGGAFYLLNASNGGGQASEARGTTSSRSSAGPTGLLLDPRVFIGQPVTDVSRQFLAAGLKPDVRDASRTLLRQLGQSLAPGAVAGLSPSGVRAKPGDTVVLYVARNGFTPQSTARTSAAPTSSAPRTTASSTPPATTTAQSSATVTSSSPVLTTSAPVSTSTSLPASSAEPPPTSVSPGSSAAGAAAAGGSGG